MVSIVGELWLGGDPQLQTWTFTCSHTHEHLHQHTCSLTHAETCFHTLAPTQSENGRKNQKKVQITGQITILPLDGARKVKYTSVQKSSHPRPTDMGTGIFSSMPNITWGPQRLYSLR